ncbi:heme biosynthesis HemY N-terminal domain-containing protein [Neomegalonema sp.]|uniref:heme biosynthesis protein HemY n=1 Tax=Neomegalonema sp. TaxID=2039713 RepID=UPI00261DB338|nr:heme biosynthesis HemY N-terminal domain-containing protein [Neomegalonema sp.]MDD2869592.1 heme biosynthesis HemY N-terminal domain-containing protein [Neomegalonema sp.]
MPRLIFRILLIFALAGAAGWGYLWIRKNVSAASITVGDRIVDVQAPLLILGLLLGGIGFYMLIRLLRLVFFAPSLAARALERQREARGVEAVTRGLAAMEVGDAKSALHEARKAEKLLHHRKDRSLARLVQARAQTLAGNADEARQYYEAMLEAPGTELAGLRGLTAQAAASGDTAKALQLTRRAVELRPRDPAVLSAAFDTQVAAHEWGEARQSLAASILAGAVPKAVGKRREAALHLAEAIEADLAGDRTRALEESRAALKIAPGLSPAAVLAARLLADGGEKEKTEAARHIEAAWAQSPHPDLAEAYAALAPDDPPDTRRKRLQRLIKSYADHPESRLLSAELALSAGDAAAARKALAGMEVNHPGARVFALMGAVARAEGASETELRQWLARAVQAPRAAWTCESCGLTAPRWVCCCPQCGSFDSFHWTWPPAAPVADGHALAAAMAPLLEGGPRAASARPGPGVEAPAAPPPRPAPGSELVPVPPKAEGPEARPA